MKRTTQFKLLSVLKYWEYRRHQIIDSKLIGIQYLTRPVVFSVVWSLTLPIHDNFQTGHGRLDFVWSNGPHP